MDWKKVFRGLVCLILVFTLLIGVSPIKARAVDPVTITAAAILGVTVLALSAYCGFALAPPDVDFVEDVGEEFSEFVQYVSGTGGLPDDDDDETNNGGDDSIDELIEQITSSTMDQLEYYTDAVGDAIKGNRTFYDAAIFGGFAGLEPAFKLFLKWMIQNGWLDRTVEVPASAGFMYYGDLLLPSLDLEDDRDYIIKFSSSSPYTMYRSSPGYSISSNSSGALNCVSYVSSNVSGKFGDVDWCGWGGLYNLVGNISDVIWSYHDILYPDGSVAVPGSVPSSSIVESQRVEPLSIVPDSVASGIVAGGILASDISLPDKVDHEKLFQGVVTGGIESAFTDSLNNAQNIADGTTTLNVFQQYITYIGPEDSDDPDPSEPSPSTDPTEPSVSPDSTEPSVSPDSTEPSESIPFDGTLGGTPVADFLTNLGNLIMAPFEWIWNQIKNLFGPWIDSIGDWFSQVRSDIQALPGKFQQWFNDIIDGIKTIPDKFEQWLTDIIDGIKTLPDKILEGLQKLFFPSNDYLSGKVDDLTGNFAFADSIVKTAQALRVGLAGITTEAPVIYIDLGAARGFHNIGGTVPFLDLRWYAEYKPTVDTVISAFLWICFVWRMLIKLPGIISGMPGDFVMTGAHAMGLDDMLPSRKKEYEIQRIDNRQTIRKGRG